MNKGIHFIDNLRTRLSKPLPGEEIQFLMAPVGRERRRQIAAEQYTPRLSAVLILLFPAESSFYTVLIQRPEYDGVHSGQVAFPGGRVEDSDVDLKHTALRETFEEIGILPENVEIIGKLSDVYISPSNYLVSPFVAYLPLSPVFKADKREVERIITIDVFKLNEQIARSEKEIIHSTGDKIKTPYYDIGGLTVWGATAMVISELNVVVLESISS